MNLATIAPLGDDPAVTRPSHKGWARRTDPPRTPDKPADQNTITEAIMLTSLPDFQSILPLSVDLWLGQQMPEYLSVIDEPELDSRRSDPASDTQLISVRREGGRRVELRQVGPMTVQFVDGGKVGRASVVGRMGCIDQLRSALTRFRGGHWTSRRIANDLGVNTAEASERTLRRLNAGG